jgi:hypothetical protein
VDAIYWFLHVAVSKSSEFLLATLVYEQKKGFIKVTDGKKGQIII